MRPPLPRQTPPPLSPTMASSSLCPITGPCTRSKTQRNKKALIPSFADLPSSLLETIMSRTVLKDNIRASAACKSWHEAAVYVRVVEKHPWLMCFPKRGGNNLFELRDPLQSKSYTLKLPELPNNSTVCYSRDGWLLMRRSISSNETFFFNPFTWELISLPKLDRNLKEAAFSCPPTSDNCVLLALCYNLGYNLAFRIWRPGATQWIDTSVVLGSLEMPRHGKLVYLDDRFYLLNLKGGYWLCSFHPSSDRWEFRQTTCLNDHNNDGPRQLHGPNKKTYHLAEKRGELFLMVTCGKEKPKVYKLVSSEWKAMSDAELDGLTFFVSIYSCEVRSNLPEMRNNVYFSRFGNNRKHCAYYSFDESRYVRYNESLLYNLWRHRGLELCPPRSIWIDPPSNVLDYFVSESVA
ncbi:unnamed protein product [Microthlaspi erraticum]|uniref:F-box domain-containing protein n=1 Tax=Microthlaspi erraticum TaxID=1685480 RepID=A0A6D2IDA6_9BRAS|nr:unnamed protein product [Microthlaspi erraticum]